MTIKLELNKQVSKVVALNMSKNTKFIIELFWESKHDLDTHAIAITKQKDGNRTIFGNPDRLLSTYNPANVLQSDGRTNIVSGEKKPFQNSGYLLHSGDSRKGGLGSEVQPEEIITIESSLISKLDDVAGNKADNPDYDEVNEVAFIVSIHPPYTQTFDQVKDAKILIKDGDGKLLLEAKLSNDFNNCNIVHVGSVVLGENGWDFLAKAEGSVGSLEDIISEL